MVLTTEERLSTLENNNLKRMVKCVSQSKDYRIQVLTKLSPLVLHIQLLGQWWLKKTAVQNGIDHSVS